jgi:hypothetical protein
MPASVLPYPTSAIVNKRARGNRETLLDPPAVPDDLERFERHVQLSYVAFEAGL